MTRWISLLPAVCMRTIRTDVFLNIWHPTQLSLTRVTHGGLAALLRILAFAHLRMLSQPCPSVLTLGDTLPFSILPPAYLLYGGWPDRRKRNCMGLAHCSRMYGDPVNFLDLSVNLKHGPPLHFPPLVDFSWDNKYAKLGKRTLP